MRPAAAQRLAAQHVLDAIEAFGLGDELLDLVRSGCRDGVMLENPLSERDTLQVGTAIVALIHSLEIAAGRKQIPRCRICACVDDHACSSGCSWVEPDLCSACAPPRARRGARRG